MTQEEIIKKAYEVYPIECGEDYDCAGNYIDIPDANLEKREAYIKGLTEQLDCPKIKGWVARDSVEDAFNGCGLILHHSKPWRTGGEWSNQTIAMHLPWSMFPDLCWEDDPIEVELKIHRV